MLHVVGDEVFEPLFRAARRYAFHLEVQNTYGVADEVEALRRWEAGGRPTNRRNSPRRGRRGMT